MDWWQQFPGWMITTLLAFLAFAIVAWQEIRRRILLPRAEWQGRWIHRPIANGRGDRYFSLQNSGDIRALDVMVMAYGCTIPGPNRGQLIRVVEVMDSAPVDLTSVNEDSYLVISWRSPNHRARKLSTWLPVKQDTELSAHHWEQKTRPWYRTLWATVRHRHYSGPGGALRAWLPNSPRQIVRLSRKLKSRAAPGGL